MTTKRSAFWAAISLILALIALPALDRGTAQAKIYKYRDDQGKLHFTDDKNNIPPQYRSGPQTEELRSITSPSSTGQPATPSSAGASGRDAKGDSVGSTGATGTSAEQVGLSEKDEKLAKESIAMLEKGVGLARQYQDAPKTFSNTKNLVTTIKGNISAKESLVAKLAKSKVPELSATRRLLQKSLPIDRDTQYPFTTRTSLFRRIMDRVVSEGPPQEVMIKKLNQALKDSEKTKAENKKAQEKAEAEKKKSQKKSESSS